MKSPRFNLDKAVRGTLLTFLLFLSPSLQAQDPISLDKVNYIALSAEAAKSSPTIQ